MGESSGAILTHAEVREHLALLPGWRLEPDGKVLARDYRFVSFPAALSFMTLVAARCELMNHHPEWTNIHERVHVRLSTHDLGGVTRMDLALADHMDEMVARLGSEA